MNKSKKYIIIGIVLILVGLGAYLYNKSRITDDGLANMLPVSEDPISLCFAQVGTPNERGYSDKYFLRMNIAGYKVTSGELKFLPAEKDSKVGTFEGSVTGLDRLTNSRTANVIWSTMGEGMTEKEELKMVFSSGGANIGFGEMEDKGDGLYGYKDKEKIIYSLNIPSVSCGELTEIQSVENYLKTNITTLSPVKASMGGTWYVTTHTLDLAKNTGTVSYEDGHNGFKKNFTYTTNDKGEVETLTIKK